MSSFCMRVLVAVLAHMHAQVYLVELNSAFRPCKQRTAAQALQEMTSVQQTLSLCSNWNVSTQICCKHSREMVYGTSAVHFKAYAMRI